MVRDGVLVWAIFSACNGGLGCLSPVDQPGSRLPGPKARCAVRVDGSDSMREDREGRARELTSFVSPPQTFALARLFGHNRAPAGKAGLLP
jgi:hypothetical protein